MSNIPLLTPKEIIRIINQKGFVFDRSRGSHQIWINPVTQKRVVIPMHNKTLPIGTFYAILKQAGIDRKEL
jgi:predicted RNA binding protein YcfA (HicA-like mRNA interferase family)